MGFRRKVRKLLASACMLMMLGNTSAGEGITVESRNVSLPYGQISYPVIQGMTDEELQDEINERIQADLKVSEAIDQMVLSQREGRSWKMEWTGGLLGNGVFSAKINIIRQQDGVFDQNEQYGCNIDMMTGHEIALEDLLTEEKARQATEEYLEYDVAPELSPHLLNAELVPLPETFLLEQTGITFLYPREKLSTLRNRAGEVKIGWNRLNDWLDMQENSIPERIGVSEMLELTEDSASKIRQMTKEGAFPDVPMRIGDRVKELTDQYQMLYDPDIYEGGRLFYLEGGCFRGVLLLTDYLSETWDESIVQGIRMDEGCAWGLVIGQTEQEQWRNVLGAPITTEQVDAEKAEAWRSETGERDYYQWDGHMLMLQSDESGKLCSMILME